VKKNFSLISLLLAVPTIIAILILLTIGMLWYKTTRNIYRENIKKVQSLYTQTAKNYSKYTIDNFIKEIKEDIEYTINKRKEKDKLELLGTFREIKGKPLQEIKRILADKTFSTNLSYYIFDNNGNCIFNPFDKDTEGKNFINLTNASGKRFIKRLIQLSQKLSTGVLIQQWPSNWHFLDKETISRNGITTFITFNNSKWILTARDDTEPLEYQLKQKWIKQLSLYRYGRNNHGYIFVISLLPKSNKNCFGIELVNPNSKNEIGKCLSLDKKDKCGFEYRKKYMSDILKKGYSFVEYCYKIPGTNKYVKKISYIKLFKKWNWILGTGTYMPDLMVMINDTKLSMEKELNHIKITIIITIAIIFLSVLMFYKFADNFVHKKLNTVFGRFERALDESRFIENKNFRIKQLKRLSDNLNKAIRKFKLYEKGYLESFANILEARDIYTKGHSQRVAIYARAIAKALGLSEEQQDRIYKAGLLHDIGKIGIPDNILLKPGKLSENEYEIIKQHARISYELLKHVEHLKDLAEPIKHHHEKCDGSGYPDGLKCKNICLEARILAIADIFDALTSTRPYRKAFSPEKAIEILKKEKVDQDILNKSKDILIEAFNSMEETKTSFMSEELDEIRGEIFKVDYMTGLLFITTFVKELREWIEQKNRFFLFGINIVGISKINYLFSTEVGNRVIESVAKAIKEIESKMKEKGCEIIGCRAYADIFFVACYSKDSNLAADAKQMLEETNLTKRIIDMLIKDGKCTITNSKGTCITEFIHLKTQMIKYPENGKSAEELIFNIEKRLKG